MNNDMIHQLTLTPLTPIHVGTGSVIEPFEYVITDRLYKFSPESFLRTLDEREQERFLKLAGQDVLVMREFVRNRFKNARPGIEYAMDVHPIALKIYEDRLKNIKSDLSVSPFIRTGQVPYIPGSSLKGAIRTAMLYAKVPKPLTEYNSKKVESEAFGFNIRRRDGSSWVNMTRDPFKFLKIGDTDKLENTTRLEAVSVHTKRDGEWSEDMTLLREVTHSLLTMPENAPEFKATISTLKNPKTGKRPFSIKQIINDCNTFYYLHLQNERKFLAALPQAQNWYNALAKTYDNLSEDSCLIRFGWGTGFDGVTINYALKHKLTKKSRRLTADLLPLGWAMLKFG